MKPSFDTHNATYIVLIGFFSLTGSTNVPGKSVGIGRISVAGPYKAGITRAYRSKENLHLREVRISIREQQRHLLSVVAWGKGEYKAVVTYWFKFALVN